MLSPAYRVASKFLWGSVIADPKEKLHKFQERIEIWCGQEDLAKADLEKIKELIQEGVKELIPAIGTDSKKRQQQLVQELKTTANIRFGIKIDQSTYYYRTKEIAEALFWAILQQYQLPPQLQRSVESASRFWSKPKLSKQRIKSMHGTYEADAEILEGYLKLCFELRKQVTTAQAAIVKGKLHSDPEVAAKTKSKAGSFTLINTGGFKDEVMGRSAEVVEKAEKAMRSIGQGRVCYGDILVSKTINNKRSVAAFYVISSDEMFIRANTPTDWDTVRVVCHELTHRLYHQFLQGRKSEIRDIYGSLRTHQFISKSGIPREALPKRGEELIVEGKKLTLTDVDSLRASVKFKKEGDPPNVGYSAPITLWFKMKGLEPHQIPGFKGFITRYAGTNEEENFCEMVSFYAIGKLPKDQVELLEPILS